MATDSASSEDINKHCIYPDLPYFGHITGSYYCPAHILLTNFPIVDLTELFESIRHAMS